MLKHLLSLLVLPASLALSAQEAIYLAHSCSYDGEENASDYYTFPASTEADRIVQEICSIMGLEKNFIVRSSNVHNAVATMADGKRVILYSTVFLEKFKADSRTQWAAYSVMAHEIGHHLNGHNFNETDPGKRKKMELEADKFSGSALRLLGAGLDDATAGTEIFALEGETNTHPAGSARREAVASGWKIRDEQLKTLGVAIALRSTPPAPDSDGDGIPDDEDKCPGEKGLPALSGCPEKKEAAVPEFMAFIAGGTFDMGDVMDDNEDDDEKPVHSVTLSSFYLGKTEVTFDEYDAYYVATNWGPAYDYGWGRGKRPVITISWIDAVLYCNWLSEKQNLTPVYKVNGSQVTANWNASGYRLPTEAEWEYAARQRGQKVRFGNGKDIADPSEINFSTDLVYGSEKSYSRRGKNREKTVQVASFPANSMGLYDMSGNVSELCWGLYDYSPSAQTNPRGPDFGYCVIRGGSYRDRPSSLRNAKRDYYRNGGEDVGFRLARSTSGE